jgi:transcriptional regulator with XRE-family HTH domain
MPEETGKARQVGVHMDAAKVYAGMDARGWIQDDLARAAGVSQMTISNVLAGKAVSRRTARQIAAAFTDSPAVLDGWLDRRAS